MSEGYVAEPVWPNLYGRTFRAEPLRGPSVNTKCSFPFKFGAMTFYGCSNIGSPSSAGEWSNRTREYLLSGKAQYG